MISLYWPSQARRQENRSRLRAVRSLRDRPSSVNEDKAGEDENHSDDGYSSLDGESYLDYDNSIQSSHRSKGSIQPGTTNPAEYGFVPSNDVFLLSPHSDNTDPSFSAFMSSSAVPSSNSQTLSETDIEGFKWSHSENQTFRFDSVVSKDSFTAL